ncbi:MAG: hypothetical protein QOD41_1000 [Cryptosporangiaceae bacterium]|nr:hypothetical protein [Cryptosporangiaceae bacterium]
MRIRSRGGRLLLTAAAAAALTVCLAPPAGAAPPVTPPGGFVVSVVVATGSGCGGLVLTVSPDSTSFTVSYLNYTAQAGPGIPTAQHRKSCALFLKLEVPASFTYAVTRATHVGAFTSIAKGSTAIEKARYQFQGDDGHVVGSEHQFPGPFDDPWQVSDQATGASNFAQCGQRPLLAATSELQIIGGQTTTSFIGLDSSVYSLEWKKCPA